MWKRALPVAILALAVAPAQASTTPSPQQQAAQAVAKGPAAVRALMKKAARYHDAALAQALLAYARTTNTASTIVYSAGYRPGCRGSISSEHTIHIGPVAISHQTVILDGFCWNGKRITSWGAVLVKRWSAAPYCWKDTSEGDYWSSRPKWRRAYAQGTLGGNAVFGCISLQSDTPYIDYANGGGVWRH